MVDLVTSNCVDPKQEMVTFPSEEGVALPRILAFLPESQTAVTPENIDRVLEENLLNSPTKEELLSILNAIGKRLHVEFRSCSHSFDDDDPSSDVSKPNCGKVSLLLRGVTFSKEGAIKNFARELLLNGDNNENVAFESHACWGMGSHSESITAISIEETGQVLFQRK